MSMPPTAQWCYNIQPEAGSPEAETLAWLRKGVGIGLYSGTLFRSCNRECYSALITGIALEGVQDCQTNLNFAARPKSVPIQNKIWQPITTF
jgi:hypothetical protein